jgi:hypothetical protein
VIHFIFGFCAGFGVGTWVTVYVTRKMKEEADQFMVEARAACSEANELRNEATRRLQEALRVNKRTQADIDNHMNPLEPPDAPE